MQTNLSINGGSGTDNDTITIEDGAATANGYQYTLGTSPAAGNYETRLSMAIPGPLARPWIDSKAIERFTLKASAGGDTIRIDATAPSATAGTYIFGGGGYDHIHIGTDADGLKNIGRVNDLGLFGQVYVDGEGDGAGTGGEVIVHDEMSNSKNTYDWNTSDVAGWDARLVRTAVNPEVGQPLLSAWDRLPRLIYTRRLNRNTLNTGTQDDSIWIGATTAAATDGYFINGNGGNDTFVIGTTANQLAAIAVKMYLDGGAGTDVLLLNDPNAHLAYVLTLLPVPGSGNVRKVGTPNVPFIEFVSIETPPVLNAPPVAVADAFTFAEDTVLSGNVLLNDTDPDADTLTASVSTGPTHGMLSLNANGTFTYTPYSNYNGSDGFTYQVSDGHGGTATAIVSFTITPVNDAPTGSWSLAFFTTQNTAITFSLAPYVSDPDGDTLTATVSSAASHGGVSIYGLSITYTPNTGFIGTDTFTLLVSDGHGGSVAVQVTIQVGSGGTVITLD